ncbi:MAG: hypothetical protein ACKPJD_00600, partial [Planctomycetaceae bacterium]
AAFPGSHPWLKQHFQVPVTGAESLNLHLQSESSIRIPIDAVALRLSELIPPGGLRLASEAIT